MASKLQQANKLLRDGKYDDAINLYSSIKDSYPNDGSIHALIEYSLGFCQKKLGLPVASNSVSGFSANIQDKGRAAPVKDLLAESAASDAHRVKVSEFLLPSSGKEQVTVLVDATDQNKYQLMLILARIVFYIIIFPNTSVFLLSKLPLPKKLNAPDWLADGIEQLYCEARGSRIHRIDQIKKGQFYDIFIKYSDQTDPDFKRCVLHTQKKRSEKYKIYDCRLSERFEASRIIDAIRDFADKYVADSEIDTPEVIAKSRLASYADDVSHQKHCNIILNGPTVANVDKISMEGGHSIVCNTVITNEEILQHANISLLCFADPIFHFGFNTYAATFRSSITSALADLPYALIAIPAKYYYVFIGLLPHLRDRVIPLEMEKSEEFNLSLLEKPALKAVGNVLTLLMLPIACTVSKKINIFGADGRPVHADTYFWGHDPSSQLDQQKMKDIKSAHPSFFDIEYNDYYLNHLKECQQIIDASKAKGAEVKLFTPSHIPAFSDIFSPPAPEIDCRGQIYIWFDFEGETAGGSLVYDMAAALAFYPDVSIRFSTHVPEKQALVRDVIKKINKLHAKPKPQCQYLPFDKFMDSARFSIVRVTDQQDRVPDEAFSIISKNKSITRIVTCPLRAHNNLGVVKTALGAMNGHKLHPESRRQIKRFSKLLHADINSESSIVAFDFDQKLPNSNDALTWQILGSSMHSVVSLPHLLEMIDLGIKGLNHMFVLISMDDLRLLESKSTNKKIDQFAKSHKGVSFVCIEAAYQYALQSSPKLAGHLFAASSLLDSVISLGRTAQSGMEEFSGLYYLSYQKLNYVTAREFVDYLNLYLEGTSAFHANRKPVCLKSMISLPAQLGVQETAAAKEINPVRETISEKSLLWVNVNPSADKPYGHYIHFDAMIAENLPKDAKAISLVHNSFPKDYKSRTNLGIIPVFTQKTSALRHPSNNDSENAEEYIQELCDSLDKAVSKNAPEIVNLFYYDGTLSHLYLTSKALAETAKRHPSIQWHLQMNLMKSSDIAYVQESPVYLYQFDALKDLPANVKIIPYIDTRGSLDYFYEYFSVPSWFPALKVLPFFTPTMHHSSDNTKKGRSNIFYHVNSTTEGGMLKKGIDIALDSIIDLAPSLPDNKLIIRRYGSTEFTTTLEKKWDAIAKLPNVQILRKQYLSDEEYRKIYYSSAVVVLPYRSTTFATRTSAGLLDSWLHGAFPVVLANTWMADQIETVGSVYGAVSGTSNYRNLNAVIKNAMTILQTMSYPDKPLLPDTKPSCFSANNFVKTLLFDSYE